MAEEIELAKAWLDAAWRADRTAVYATRRMHFRTEIERRLQELGYSADDYQHLTDSDYSCSTWMLPRCDTDPFISNPSPAHAVLEDLSDTRAVSSRCPCSRSQSWPRSSRISSAR